MRRTAGSDHGTPAPEGGLDRPSKDELLSQDAHGGHRARAHDRLPGARHKALHERSRVIRHLFRRRDDTPCEHEAPGAGVHQPMIGSPEMLFPSACADFLGYELVGGFFIRNAQQGFCKAHEREALSG